MKEVKMGPGGGNGGSAKEMTVRESLLRLESITIKSGSYVDSLAFSYVDTHGNRHTEGPWGGSGGNSQTVSLLLDLFVYGTFSTPFVKYYRKF
jgi:hypothetical protein